MNRFVFKTVLLLSILAFLSTADAITNRNRDDCENNSTNLNCEHPNVVSISGFFPDLSSVARCSGSLIKKDTQQLVFLTAAHCSAVWQNIQFNVSGFQIGVSFDANANPPDSYVLGAQVVTADEFLKNAGLVRKAWNIVGDYGLVVLQKSSNGYVTYGGTNISSVIDNLTPVPLIQGVNVLNDLITSKRSKITHVGYGIGVIFNGAGDGGNKGGVGDDFSTFLKRGIAEDSTFKNYGGQYNQWIIGSQNLNKGENGSCSGDSGGPGFIQLNNQEVQIGVISSGDSLCVATFIDQRLDTTDAQAFLNCALTSNPLTCGCSTFVDNKGNCI